MIYVLSPKTRPGYTICLTEHELSTGTRKVEFTMAEVRNIVAARANHDRVTRVPNRS